MVDDIRAILSESQLPYRVEQMGKQQSESRRRKFTDELQKRIVKKERTKDSPPLKESRITDKRKGEGRNSGGKGKGEEKKQAKGQSDSHEKQEDAETGRIIDVKV